MRNPIENLLPIKISFKKKINIQFLLFQSSDVPRTLRIEKLNRNSIANQKHKKNERKKTAQNQNTNKSKQTEKFSNPSWDELVFYCILIKLALFNNLWLFTNHKIESKQKTVKCIFQELFSEETHAKVKQSLELFSQLLSKFIPKKESSMHHKALSWKPRLKKLLLIELTP